MNWRASLALVAVLAPLQAKGERSPLPSSPGAALCRPAIAAAERAYGIPPNLLAAIARVETGRKDAESGKYNPWPWTINADGQGSFYEGKSQAVAAATAMRPLVSRSIDVGCMQISLTMHPNAFTSMEQAFDPMANADYGGKFLKQLYDKTQSWPKAVGMYHSGTPELGSEYQTRVYAVWPDEIQTASSRAAVAAGAAPGVISPFGFGWNRVPVQGMITQAGPRIIPLNTGGAGSVMQGRSLDSYRASPVRVISRILP
jgi:hypothetical protein